MTIIDDRIASKNSKWASKSDTWFAWRPVRTGALGSGSFVWLRKVCWICFMGGSSNANADTKTRVAQTG